MSKLTKNNQSGFTIIEVVLSLAIGAMIIGMVFIALPSLQKQRRDTARKNDQGRMMGQLEAFASNNNGKYPVCSPAASFDGFKTNYLLKDAFEDPKTGAYTLTCSGSSAAPATLPGSVSYHVASKCDPASPEQAIAGVGRDIAVIMVLERGVSCQSNQ